MKEKFNPSYSGVVLRGKSRGRELGFPTANLSCSIPDNALSEGVYAAVVCLGTKDLPSLAFFGASRTFGETEKKLEVYILDFSEDIYGQELTVTLLKKIRDNKRFSSKEDLISQMQQDEQEARLFFDTQGKHST